MIIKVKKNPTTCIELGNLIGWPVKQWTDCANGDIEAEVEGSPTEEQVAQIVSLLERSKSHLAIEGNADPLTFYRDKWEKAKATSDPALKIKRLLEVLGRAANLEV